MRNIIRRRARVQLGFIGLVIISCFLLITSAIVRINNIRATCEPLSGINQNRTEVSESDVVEKPQPQIIEESTSVAVEKASSVTEPTEEPNLKSIERSEPAVVAALEMEVAEQTRSEESIAEPEPWTAENAPHESTMESTFVAEADPKPEPKTIEKPESEVIEETETQVIEEIDTEITAEVESEEILEVSEPDVVEEPQPQIVAESTSVAVEEASSEPEPIEEPNLENVERSEPELVVARETEITEETEAEENLVEPEPGIAEDTPYESTVESTSLVDAEPMPEPEMIEEPGQEVIEETVEQAIEETDTEIFAEMEPEEAFEVNEPDVVEEPQPQIIEESTSVVIEETSFEPEPIEEPNLESDEISESLLVGALKAAHETEAIEQIESEENLVEPEPWTVEDTSYESTVESTIVVDAEPMPEPEMIEEPSQEVIEETAAQAIEETDIEIFEEMEPEEVFEVKEPDVVEEPQPQIVEESTSVVAEEAYPEPELSEELNPEVIEETEVQTIEEADTEVFAEMESEETLVEYELNIVEEPQPQTIEDATSVAAEEAYPEPEVPEELNLEVIEETEAQAIEETDTEVSEEMETEETLVAYEVGVAEEPRQENVEEQESAFSTLFQGIYAGKETAKVARPTAESKPKVIEESRLNDSAIESDSVSLRLSNIISGKAEPAVTEKPQAKTTGEVKPNEKVSEPKVVEEPRQKTAEKKKSLFSFLQGIFKSKSSNNNTK